MKLATYQDGSRDGQLVVVSTDLSQAHFASHIANRLQQVLDDWNYLSPQLQDLSAALRGGKARHAFPFDPKRCMAPLPRAFQLAQGAGFVSHLERLYQARSVDLPGNISTEPVMVQGSGDNLLGPCEPISCANQDLGIDFGAGLAVVSAELSAGCTSERALEGVRLVMLCNAVCLRQLWPAGEALALGGVQASVAVAFSPVAVTPDELGDPWHRGRLHVPLQVSCNGRKVGACDAGEGMHFHFGRLLSHLCKTRAVHAGAILLSGPVSNKAVLRKGKPDWPAGYCSIAEKRAMETLQEGQASTPYLRFGDTLHIEMQGQDGSSIFGAIEQQVLSTAQAGG
jgi:fumarylacetoacetate (FAA) hydrolase